MTKTMAAFDVADIYREHCYLVSISKGKDAKTQVYEVFGRAPDPGEREWAPETLLRCEVPRATWDAISGEVRAEFNRRLKSMEKPAGRWGADETAVQRLLGKEMLVLLWAIEQGNVSAEETAVAIRNWLGLKPEERWWLYTMTAAATGYAHQAAMGWRNALRAALCFGTRKDAFHLASVVGRGTLAPRPNEGYQPPKKAAKGKGGGATGGKAKGRKKKPTDTPGFEFASAKPAA
jgi:hypothetical protein